MNVALSSLFIFHSDTTPPSQSIVFVYKVHFIWMSCVKPFMHSFSSLFCCSSVCLNLTPSPLPVPQNTSAGPGFAQFDAFGNGSESMGGFPSSPEAAFQPPNTGRANLFDGSTTHPDTNSKKLTCVSSNTTY